jgi:RimJ/RimL family protein N-acetyltransferase
MHGYVPSTEGLAASNPVGLLTPALRVVPRANEFLISDGSIGLRQFTLEDVSLLFNAVHESMAQLSAWMVWAHPNYSMEDTRAFVLKCGPGWEKGEQYSFAMIDLQGGQFLGSVGLSGVNRAHGFANLGYWVRTGKTRNGVATSATRMAARFSFETLGLNRVELLVPTANVASQRVAEKAGAKREGLLRKRLRLNGMAHDSFVYSLVVEPIYRADFFGQAGVADSRIT